MRRLRSALALWRLKHMRHRAIPHLFGRYPLADWEIELLLK